MDPHDPGRLMPRRPRPSFAVVMTLLGTILLLARPVSGAGPVPDASLPVPVPSLPLPPLPTRSLATLPVPTPELPTLPPPPTQPPLPTVPPPPTPSPPPLPTLPVPTPTVPIPSPSLPIATVRPPTPAPSPSPSIAGAGANPSGPVTPLGAAPLSSPAFTSRSPDAAASAGPDQVTSTTPGAGAAPFDTFVLPGLLVGVPTILLLAILAAQVAVGTAWLPVIRRWLNRRV